MRVAIDANVLVVAHVPGVPRHEVAREFLRAQMQTSDVSLVVTALVLQEFVHVITDARRFDPPASTTEAIAIAKGYLARTNVECLAIDDESCRVAFELHERHRLGRRRMADCLLAATLLNHGIHRLATFNTRDFSLFAPLRAFEPDPRT